LELLPFSLVQYSRPKNSMQKTCRTNTNHLSKRLLASPTGLVGVFQTFEQRSSPLSALIVILALLLVIVVLLLVLTSLDPRVPVVERGILAREVVALTTVLDVVPPALRQSTGTGGELGGHGGILGDPVGEGVLTVLDDGLGGLVTVVGGAGLAGGHGGVVDELEEVLAVAGDDGHLLAVLTEGVELVGVRGLDLLTSNVRELGFSDKRLGFGTDKLLLENDDLGGVGLLVLQLGDLIGNLLFPCG
jgi:hypothetical protein